MQKFYLSYNDIVITVKKISTSKRMRIIIHNDGTITLTCPIRVSRKEIEKFVEINYNWIVETTKKNVSLQQESFSVFSNCDIERLKKEAMEYIPKRLDELAQINNLQYKELTIGSAKTKWGSCTRDGRIRISCFVMLLKKELIDYVLLHELCHLIHFNHSALFHKKLNEMLAFHNEKELVKEIRLFTKQR